MSQTCGFCRGTAEVVGPLSRLEKVLICPECADSFSHQLGHEEGRCSNCGRTLPEAQRLHGEGDLRICELCLLELPDIVTSNAGATDDPPGNEPTTTNHGSGDLPLTHLTPEGDVHMVDVGSKQPTVRKAAAEAVVHLSDSLARRFFSGDLPKGDALATVRLAGIMAAKKTPDLIPLAHPIALTSVTVEITPHQDGVRVVAECGLTGRTGVEMEAMTAVSVAALTLYDMVKSIERGVVIGPIRLLTKSGGRSGEWASGPVSLADS